MRGLEPAVTRVTDQFRLIGPADAERIAYLCTRPGLSHDTKIERPAHGRVRHLEKRIRDWARERFRR